MAFGFFDESSKVVKKGSKIFKYVSKEADKMSGFSEAKFQARTKELQGRLKKGESLDDILPDAFAVIKAASKKFIGLDPFEVQVIGAYAIHNGNIAEMKTGEGKSLTAVFPAYLNALDGKGVHIITVNDYLAQREADGAIGNLFRTLGLTVGLNKNGIPKSEKKEVYACDIIYTTHSELGFDYLRDNMAHRKEEIVIRDLNYCIIDEIDSILIDEARTPLIISGGKKDTKDLYEAVDKFAKSLKDSEYDIDVEARHCVLTQKGIAKAEKHFKVKNLYDVQNVDLTHRINNALRANYIMADNVDYVVNDGAVEIVDQFTGRILKGRQYSQGLHQAIEAKEGVEIKQETETYASITYQNLFRMYKKLSGMTGTAKTEEEEFLEIYNMFVIEVPTNVPVIRKDLTDRMYGTAKGKYEAIAEDVFQRNKKGQPVLVGTISVEVSEIISGYLTKRGIKHEILNAKNHFREAEIIENAGAKGSVTIATNMAGRGTDIKLSPEVLKLGGLAVIGTERHESRRIDNQLRGRSGRQGEPGESKFYISTEDDLFIRFGNKMLVNQITKLSLNKTTGKDEGLESKMVSSTLKGAQRKIEGSNYDARKDVLKYDDVVAKQRELIYAQRTSILMNDDLEADVVKMIDAAVDILVDRHCHSETGVNYEGVIAEFNGIYYPNGTLDISDLKKMDENKLKVHLKKINEGYCTVKKDIVPYEIYKEFLKTIVLRTVDQRWRKHIEAMAALRSGVALQAYGQGKPLIMYQEEGLKLFNEMNNSILRDVSILAVRAQLQPAPAQKTRVAKV